MSENVPQLQKSETVYEGKVFNVQRDHLTDDKGKTSNREIVVHPDAVTGIAKMADGRFILVRQYRHPARAFLWELPAGKIDPGESPEEAFRRELMEECGVGCGTVKEVGSFYTSPGILTERLHLFVATECKEGGGDPHPGEIAEWKTVTLEEARKMVDEAEIVDAKTIVGLRYA